MPGQASSLPKFMSPFSSIRPVKSKLGIESVGSVGGGDVDDEESPRVGAGHAKGRICQSFLGLGLALALDLAALASLLAFSVSSFFAAMA